jgi:hypothetical protein
LGNMSPGLLKVVERAKREAVYLHPAANYHRLTRPTFTGAKRPRRAGSHGLPAAL